MYKSFNNEAGFSPSTSSRESTYSTDHVDDSQLRINVTLTPCGLAIACLANDGERKSEAIAPVVLHVSKSTDKASASGLLAQPVAMQSEAQLRETLSQLVIDALMLGCTGGDAFVRHVALALFAMSDGDRLGMKRTVNSENGGLKPWQTTLAKELLGSNLQEPISLHEVARTCGLSTSHFGRAFKKSMGVPPHRWVQIQRLERVKSLLADPDRSLAEIAGECGFCEQSHLNHAFSNALGLSPGAWRKRQRRNGASRNSSMAATGGRPARPW